MVAQRPSTLGKVRRNTVATTCAALQCSRKKVIARKHKLIGSTTSLQDVNTVESQAIIECTFITTVKVPKIVSIRSHHRIDRKSTRLNSSHVAISYAVFC